MGGTAHHIFFDGTTYRIFFDDVAKVYDELNFELAPEIYDALDAANEETKSARANDLFSYAALNQICPKFTLNTTRRDIRKSSLRFYARATKMFCANSWRKLFGLKEFSLTTELSYLGLASIFAVNTLPLADELEDISVAEFRKKTAKTLYRIQHRRLYR